MAAFVCLVSAGYADVMFQYSRNNAVRAAITGSKPPADLKLKYVRQFRP
jgi:hypothetical protein